MVGKINKVKLVHDDHDELLGDVFDVDVDGVGAESVTDGENR